MKRSKTELKARAKKTFKELGGGTQVEPEFTASDSKVFGRELQKSFDKIFPELIKPSKYRKHVIFDEDVFQFFEKLSGDNGSKFSSMINSALRSFVRERLLSRSKDHDPVAELLAIRERERELIREIKELDLTKELKQKLG